MICSLIMSLVNSKAAVYPDLISRCKNSQLMLFVMIDENFTSKHGLGAQLLKKDFSISKIEQILFVK